MRITTFTTGSFVFLLLFSILPSNASAFVIYSESVGGDFPNFPDPWDGGNIDPDFVMPEGESTIDGDLALPEMPDDTDDWFTFLVPEEVEIPELKMEWDSPGEVLVAWEMYRFEFLFISPPEMIGSWFLPLSPGITEVDLTEETPEGGGPPIGTIPGGKYGIRFKTAEDPSYSITFTGQAIPEPTTLTLAGLGLSFIAMRRRR
jgi:hypothetical protein